MLAGFFYADEELNMVATELDSFDGRKDPERCTALVNQLRMCQDKVPHFTTNSDSTHTVIVSDGHSNDNSSDDSNENYSNFWS